MIQRPNFINYKLGLSENGVYTPNWQLSTGKMIIKQWEGFSSNFSDTQIGDSDYGRPLQVQTYVRAASWKPQLFILGHEDWQNCDMLLNHPFVGVNNFDIF